MSRPDRDLLEEAVFRVVEAIPPGRAAAYSTVGQVVGTGARQVGRLLSQAGAPLPWWRVVNVRGELPPALIARARPHWEAEGTPRRAGPAPELGLDPRRLLSPEELARLAEPSLAELSQLSQADPSSRN